MPSVIVVGTQWGDEGKGKIIDLLTRQAKHAIRSQGGNNAGHTILVGSEEYKLHLVPSGIIHPHTQCYVAAGTVLDPKVLIEEIEGLNKRGIQTEGRLWLSHAAHLIFPYHLLLDKLIEESKGERRIGTTGRGIGPCYVDKANRVGIRLGELIRGDIFPKLFKSVLEIKNRELSLLYNKPPLDYALLLEEYLSYGEKLKRYAAPVEEAIHRALAADENILFEGAQGAFLDGTLGTYPYVTSSNTLASAIAAGAGVGPSQITHTLGVLKAYTTRVGNGPLPSELNKEESFSPHQKSREIGTTTGRNRRIGWFDGVLARTSVMYNGIQSLALTKLDVLDDLKELKICTGYSIDGKVYRHFPSLTEDLQKVQPIYEIMPGWCCSLQGIDRYEKLPLEAKNYIHKIEQLCGAPVSILSLGPERDNTIMIRPIFEDKGALL